MKYPSDTDVAGCLRNRCLGKDSALLAGFCIQRLQMGAFQLPRVGCQMIHQPNGHAKTRHLPAAGKDLFPDSKPETGAPRAPLAPAL